MVAGFGSMYWVIVTRLIEGVAYDHSLALLTIDTGVDQ